MNVHIRIDDSFGKLSEYTMKTEWQGQHVMRRIIADHIADTLCFAKNEETFTVKVKVDYEQS